MAVADDSSSPKVSSRLLIFALVSSVVGALIGCLIYFSINGKIDDGRGQSPAPFSTTSRLLIPKVCNATRFPELCEASLNKSGVVPPVTTPLQVVQSALSLTSHNLGSAQEMLQAILKNYTGNQNRTIAGKICLEVLGHSMHRLNSTADSLPRGRMKDARAWTSAALSYQYDCWSGLKKVNDTQMVVDTMSFLNNTVIASTSITLSMMMSYEQFGNETGSWSPPKTERDGFWEKVAGGSNSGREIGVPTDLKEDVTVCNGGNGSACTHKTVQEAVDAAPENLSVDKRFVIRIKEGVYNETVRVPFAKKNLVFVGDGPGKSVITGSYHVGQPGMTTYESATVGVLGDGFMARDLTIENTAGPTANQAVALRSDSDLSVLENCELIGNQDTLYAHSLRQFYKSCTIYGNIDFIFGNSASFFHNCTILIVPRSLNPEMGENNAVSAHGRTDPAQTTGLFFQDCLVNGTDEYMKVYHAKPSVHKNYLGRPWKEFSRTVFVKCKLEELISPAGWMIWEGDFALNTLYYGEFGNTGLGANLTAREKWSSQIPENHVDAYSVQNFIQDDERK